MTNNTWNDFSLSDCITVLSVISLTANTLIISRPINACPIMLAWAWNAVVFKQGTVETLKTNNKYCQYTWGLHVDMVNAVKYDLYNKH